MVAFSTSTAAYEDRLREIFKSSFREQDLHHKHEKMKDGAFEFLRGTCWRWAECARELCPELMDAAEVGSVGDAHAGNFGLWRDAEGRLVWGVNDFDEAAVLPYALELVRLCASFMVANPRLSAHEIADPLLKCYRDGLDDPHAYVLERKHLSLRDAFAADDDEREEFWAKLDAAAPEPPPNGYEAALKAGLGPVEDLKISARVAGVGSLGRPRFVASGKMQGGPVAREVKGRAPSCWVASWGASDDPGLASRLAGGVWRSPDPHLNYGPVLVHRRLAPNSSKIKFEKLKERDVTPFVHAMAADLAAVHLGLGEGKDAVGADLDKRPGGWLAEAAARVAEWTLGEFRKYSG